MIYSVQYEINGKLETLPMPVDPDTDQHILDLIEAMGGKVTAMTAVETMEKKWWH